MSPFGDWVALYRSHLHDPIDLRLFQRFGQALAQRLHPLVPAFNGGVWPSRVLGKPKAGKVFSLAESTIRVCFLSEDSGLADAIGRALGEGFAARSNRDFSDRGLNDLHDWCDVAVLDLRSAGTPGNCERGLSLLDEIAKVPNHPPAVVLCDADNRELLLEAVAR